MKLSFYEIFQDVPAIDVVDIGSSPIDGEPPYQPLVAINKAKVVGFEPNPAQFRDLEKLQTAYLKFLPYAIGDGNEHELKLCKSAGMCSLLEPDMEILDHFYGFGEWGQVIGRQMVPTRRLDDVKEITGIDYLKLDVQGSELSILKNAPKRLEEALVVHIEVNFVPFYKDQPLFGELDIALREAGFYLHKFLPLVSRTFKPVMVDNDIYAGLSQVLWTDAVYVRKFPLFSQLTNQQLLKIAAIAHDLYDSYDLCSLALCQVDKNEQGGRQQWYMNKLMGQG